MSIAAQAMHQSSTGFPHRWTARPRSLDALGTGAYAGNFMKAVQRPRGRPGSVVVAGFALAAALALPATARADDATLLRVFLKDGTSLVSYGEPAHVGDRVVFSMPTGASPNPPLHLVNLSADRVDWDRTNRYSSSARASHYIANRAEMDYAALSNTIADALNQVSLTADPQQR